MHPPHSFDSTSWKARRAAQTAAGLAMLGAVFFAACSSHDRPRTESSVLPQPAPTSTSPAVQIPPLPPLPDFGRHPAAETLARLYAAAPAGDFTPTGLTRKDYLTLIAGNVDFFKQHQNPNGAIIDPYRRSETQYATPAFAMAAALLARDADRKDLLEPATRAMTLSLTALLSRGTADNHPDFYIPLIVHALELLEPQVAQETRAAWENQLRNINIETTYRADFRGMNWNIVSSAGELLRRTHRLVPAERAERQIAYIEQSLQGHTRNFTPFGLYLDPNAPLAYDAFSRLWLDDVMAAGAYEGRIAGQIGDFLKRGGLSTLLLLSPSGEWANGGRSALHNWNEAEIVAIAEIQANHWQKAGQPRVAGSFKRAAHLAYQSMKRWQRPSGEMWIVKNRADPTQRFGYEAYSYHSQYNLLPMAMLAIAYRWADDGIAETAAPAETGGYVFDVRETFHKVAAAAGGYYVLIDTSADVNYNGTGLQRIHRAGVGYPPYSDSAAGERGYGPAAPEKLAMTPGLEWRTGNGQWRSLANFSGGEGGRARLVVRDVDLKVVQQTPERVAFEIDYTLGGTGEEGRHMVESYEISAQGVRCTIALSGGDPVSATRMRIPVLVSDGMEETRIATSDRQLTVTHRGAVMTWSATAGDTPLALTLQDPRTATHSGFVQAAIADVPAAGGAVTAGWVSTLR